MNTHTEITTASTPVQADILALCSLSLSVLAHTETMTMDEVRAVLHVMSDAKKAILKAYALRLMTEELERLTDEEALYIQNLKIKNMTRDMKDYARRLKNRSRAITAKMTNDLQLAIEQQLAEAFHIQV